MSMMKNAILFPFPASDTPGYFRYSISALFQETAPGHYEACISSEILSQSFSGSHTFLYFDRVGCRAKITAVNDVGNTIRKEHYGSYTDWCMEVTTLLASPASSLHIALELSADEKTLSPYQKAGILGDILYVVLPRVYLADFHIVPEQIDDTWFFQISCPINESISKENDLQYDIEILSQTSQPCAGISKSITDCSLIRLAVSKPSLWSPEAPYLYQIIVRIKEGSRILGVWKKKAGLYSIEKDGRQVLLNHSPLKLKGLAYREPLTAEKYDCKDDLKLFSEANVTYLRSLCYPFSTRLLDLCDELGILVEQSAPIEQVGQGLPSNQNAPALRELFLNQYREMLLRDRSHPCILLWSLGNDCVWGDQFRKGMSLMKDMDSLRLVNFHLPMTIPHEDWIPDVWNVQYSAWNLNADICYDQMVIFHTQGADTPIGYACGMAQDYHLPVLHDAYAPVPVHDLDDLERDPGVHEFWGESVKRFWDNIDTTPGSLGGAVMAAADEDGSFHPSLTGFTRGILDVHHKPKPEYWHLKMAYRSDPFIITKKPSLWTAANSRIRCTISPETGLIAGVWVDSKQMICSGPFLHTGRFVKGTWKPDSLPVISSMRKGICLTISGSYGDELSAVFSLTLTEEGLLTTDCRITSLGRPMPHTVKSGIGLDPGGLDELGIRYLLPADIDTLSWSRHSLYHTYPSGHIGRPHGTAVREQTDDFTSMKANITDACVSSPYGVIRVISDGSQHLRLSLSPDHHCMIESAQKGNTLAQLNWSGNWYQINDPAGGFYSNEMMSHEKGASCEIRFHGTGIVVYGSTDRIRGCCNVSIDGQAVIENLSQHTPAVQYACMSRGYEKRYHTILFQTDSLEHGDHVCRIEITGEKEAQSQGSYISLDSFEIFSSEYPRQVSMIICSDYNYPRLVMGNYMRPPVILKKGDRLSCNLFLCESVSCIPSFDRPSSTNQKGELEP